MKTHLLVSFILISVALLVTAAAISVLVVTKPPTRQQSPAKVIPRVLAPPIRAERDYTVRIIGYGEVRPRIEVQITAEVSGKVVQKAPNYLSGNYVTAGQMLFQIDKTDYEQARAAADGRIGLLDARLARLAQEEANLMESEKIDRGRLELAQKQHGRAVELLKRGAGTENEVDAALEVLLARRQQLQSILSQKALIAPHREQLQAERRIAQVEKEQAQTALERTTVSSPVSGRVLSCDVEVGERVQAGGSCGVIYGTDVMEVPVSIPASDLQWIDPELLEACKHGKTDDPAGRHIRADLDWLEPRTERIFRWEGCVERIEAGLEARTRTAMLVVRVKNPPVSNPQARPSSREPPSGSGRPGEIPLDLKMFCKVSIQGRTEPRAYALPRTAIQPGNTVFLANEGKLSQRRVSVARFTNDKALILPGRGIEEGDRVVLSYVPKPVLGMWVDPVGELSAEPETPVPPAASPQP